MRRAGHALGIALLAVQVVRHDHAGAIVCSQTLRFCGSGMVMRSPKPRTPGANMSNERFSCIRMTTCSTSLMVPVRLFAGIASARRMAGGNIDMAVRPAVEAAALRRKRRLPAWTRSLSDFTDFFPFAVLGWARLRARNARAWPAAAASRAGCPDRPVVVLVAAAGGQRSASAPRPGAGHGAGSGEVHAFFILEHQGNSSNIDLPDSASDLTSSSVRSSKYMV